MLSASIQAGRKKRGGRRARLTVMSDSSKVVERCRRLSVTHLFLRKGSLG